MKALIFVVFLCLLCTSVQVNADPPHTVKMQLSWKHQFQFAGYYAALEKGFYKAEGLEVELLEGGPGVSCDEDVLLTQAQYCNGPGSLVKQRIDGEEIVVLASFIQHSPVVLITLEESGLSTPNDLIGKRVETQLGGVPIAEIKAMFQSESVSLDQLDNRENSAGLDALINGDVDAKYAFVTNEPQQLDSLGIRYNVIHPRSYGIDFYGDALFTSESETLNHPRRADKFLQATIKGWEYAIANKSEIARLIMRQYRTEASYDELLAEADAIERLMLPELVEIGHINKARWQATAKTLMSLGLVKKGFSLDGFIYDDPEQEDDAWLLKLLVTSLSIAVFLSLVLWTFNRMMSIEIKSRAEAQRQLKRVNKEILKQAYTDELSGMGNRRSFYEQAEAEISLAKLDNTQLAALMIDIDLFKSINDRFGHAAGDKVIQDLAAVILQIVRANDVQGRIGGEEFGIITTNTDLEGAKDLAERIRAAVESLDFAIDSSDMPITVSIGLTGLDPNIDDVNSLLARADRALYQAKHQGRNQVVVCPLCYDDSAIIGPIESGLSEHEYRANPEAAK